jgi:sn-glycerol 3-phosphate transport system ATP-binding protein
MNAVTPLDIYADIPLDALSLPAEVEAVEPVGAERFLYYAATGSCIVVRAFAKPGD